MKSLVTIDSKDIKYFVTRLLRDITNDVVLAVFFISIARL